MLHDFGSLTEKALWIHQIFKNLHHEKRNEKIQNHLKFEGLD